MSLPVDDLAGVGLAWARFIPTLALVPAFGLRALPAPARAVLGLALAASVYPSVMPVAHLDRTTPWLYLVASQVAIGVPVALAAAIPLWSATMAGGLVDTLRGSPSSADVPTVPDPTSSFGVLLSLFASVVFLATGGAARAAASLARDDMPAHPLLLAAHDIVSGIGLAVAIGGPLLAAAIVLDLTSALVARAASPAHVHTFLAPLKALGLLVLFALALERLATLIGAATRDSLRPL